MNIALHDADNTNYPNLALMKLSNYHQLKGDGVNIYDHILNDNYDIVYSSKVFSFTKTEDPIGNVIEGGTGYNKFNNLMDEVEHICPDYQLYNLNYSLGFLTRGCVNNCSFCIVPKKEGKIKAHCKLDEFVRHENVILMDNNILACDHGINQIEEIIKKRLKVDFNQGLDSRLIDNSIAKLLSKVRWLKPLRLACDNQDQKKYIQKAVTFLRWHNVTPIKYSVYCLINDIDESIDRIKFLKGIHLDPFALPYRDFRKNIEPTIEQKKLARWVNHKAVFKSVEWEKYE